ncbi:peptidoglycan DD-metalloendopeptidase family protein [uncultured Desulfuromonas sp.]|uniref:peptidoglycan DD-metalloendopeptidase family protein n=1 Tax=uncultured Desulfuromonas sp. TaxID=181013 RepID=UPI002AABD962|nr:peptidoglycan DD-metalloendopeptidase family protein [uncultured Desulfuromonas sp.]
MRVIALTLLTLITLVACAISGVNHVVQPGQTLYRISKTYGVSADKIAAYNHVKDPTQIKAGESLWIPGVRHTRTVAVVPGTAHTTSQKSTPKVVRKKKVTPAKTVKKKKTPTKTTQPARNAPHVAAKKGLLDWPVRGRVLQTYGVKNGERSKGIVIAASAGTPVRCAAAGQVIYSGSGIKGYGHLLIVKHSDNLYTVYGHNRSTLVKTGAFVNKGQTIALSGRVPSLGQGGVHFEVRQGNQAVNPAFYLP